MPLTVAEVLVLLNPFDFQETEALEIKLAGIDLPLIQWACYLRPVHLPTSIYLPGLSSS